MTIEITYFNIVGASDAILEEVGFDFRYIPEGLDKPQAGQSCYNWHNGADGVMVPGCIVGTILHRLGVSLEDMGKAAGSNDLLYNLTRDGKITIIGGESRIKTFLRIAQTAQDNGATWHSAIRTAEMAASIAC